MKTVLRHGTFPISDKGGVQLPAHTSMCFVATGRSALYHLAKKLRAAKDVRRVLLPGFVPDGVLFPFVAAGIDIQFYRITETLAPDVDDIMHLLTDGASDLVVLIHYFGRVFSDDAEDISVQAQARGGYLLEDCAHALFHRPTFSDFTLYSLNKTLPVPDGAILLSRSPEVDVRVSGDLPPMPQGAISAYMEHLRANEAFAQATRESAWPPMDDSQKAFDRYYDIIGGDCALYRPSTLAHLALRLCRYPDGPSARLLSLTDDETRQMTFDGVYAERVGHLWHVPEGHEPPNDPRRHGGKYMCLVPND